MAVWLQLEFLRLLQQPLESQNQGFVLLFLLAANEQETIWHIRMTRKVK